MAAPAVIESMSPHGAGLSLLLVEAGPFVRPRTMQKYFLFWVVATICLRSGQ